VLGRARVGAGSSGAEGRIVYPVRYSTERPAAAGAGGAGPRDRAVGRVGWRRVRRKIGDHVAPEGGRSPARLAASHSIRHWRGAVVRRRRMIPDAARRFADQDGPSSRPSLRGRGGETGPPPALSQGERGRTPSPRPSPRGRGGGTREGALTPALSQGERGRTPSPGPLSGGEGVKERLRRVRHDTGRKLPRHGAGSSAPIWRTTRHTCMRCASGPDRAPWRRRVYERSGLAEERSLGRRGEPGRVPGAAGAGRAVPPDGGGSSCASAALRREAVPQGVGGGLDTVLEA